MSRRLFVLLAFSSGLVLGLFVGTTPGSVWRGSSTGMPRTADGHPDLGGVWQVLNAAAWDLEDHGGRLGVPPGQSVVEGGEIPYQPWALKQREEHSRQAAKGDPFLTVTIDPLSHCYMPGVPRATYLPFPFHIVQGPERISISYEFARTSRQIYMNRPHVEGRLYNWMGDSIGRWEGDTLVVDVVDFNGRTWFDAAGNFHSDELHVIERFTPIDRDHIHYEAMIDDPKVFLRPWKISMPLYRRVEPRAQVLEYMCIEYKEPLFYDEP